jgi:3-oxoacyl-[acyl-carrier-protein] synthase II
MTGHLLGAAGAIESVATVLSIHHGVVPPTINLVDPDDELRVDVPREAREMQIDAAINDSFGFGGHNTSVVFTKA